jgi:hypothetical protein
LLRSELEIRNGIASSSKALKAPVMYRILLQIGF